MEVWVSSGTRAVPFYSCLQLQLSRLVQVVISLEMNDVLLPRSSFFSRGEFANVV